MDSILLNSTCQNINLDEVDDKGDETSSDEYSEKIKVSGNNVYTESDLSGSKLIINY